MRYGQLGKWLCISGFVGNTGCVGVDIIFTKLDNKKTTIFYKAIRKARV